MRLILAAAAAALVAGVAVAQEAADPFGWLEDIGSARSTEWVKGQNQKSLSVLTGDKRYETFRGEALAIFTAKDRIPAPAFRAGGVDNFWQDEAHRRGLWRHTTLESYANASPQWTTLLDVDALAKAEGKDWYFKGAECLQPEERTCLVHLSAGGKDAVNLREFDTVTGKFVDGGFDLPEAKQSAEWIDKDTLIVGTNWGPGSLTVSGYPYVLKIVKRGQPLSAAKEIYRGDPKDVSATAFGLRDEDGRLQAVFIRRALSSLEGELYLLDGVKPVRLPLPNKSDIQTLIKGQMVFTIEEDWNGFKSGDLLAYDLAALKANPATAKAKLIARPSSRQSFEQVAATRTHLIVTGLDDVMGFADIYSLRKGRWTSKRLPLPKAVSVGVSDASKSSDRLFLSSQGLLEPTALWLVDADKGSLTKAKVMPARFDASKMVVEQFWAKSSDGARIPYFVVRPKGRALDGTIPTLMYGYGGFQVSKPSVYIPRSEEHTSELQSH